MSKHIVIAVGGTGARVIRSLLYLWASGSRQNADSLLPVFIDTDLNCGSYNKCLEIQQNYDSIFSATLEDGQDNIDKYFGNSIPKTYRFSLKDILKIDKLDQGLEFGAFLQNLGENEDNSHDLFIEKKDEINDYLDFIKLFYSDEELKLDIRDGFYGNPKLGSLVLSKIDFSSNSFGDFRQELNGAHTISVVGSLHGGTGSTGIMPVIKGLHGYGNRKNVFLIEPYYQINSNKENKIQSNAFVHKANNARDIYVNFINDQNQNFGINSCYLISGNYSNSKTYDYQEAKQQNPAHWVELIAAIAIRKEQIEDANQQDGNVLKKRFYVWKDDNDSSNKIKFGHLRAEPIDRDILSDFAGFALFMNYFKNKIIPSIETDGIRKKEAKLNFIFNNFSEDWGSHLLNDKVGFINYLNHFNKYLEELKDGDDGLSFFKDMAASAIHPVEFINDEKDRRKGGKILGLLDKDANMISNDIDKELIKKKPMEIKNYPWKALFIASRSVMKKLFEGKNSLNTYK